jgi:hypothetical protein
VCPEGLEEDGDSVAALGNVSTAMLVIGGIGLAAGVVLIVVPIGGGDEAKGKAAMSAPQVALGLGVGSLQLSGRF